MRKKLALYIHIPFCFQKCPYCDFNSYPLEKNQAAVYHEILEKEIELYQRNRDFSVYQVTSIYFGGGTPTTLDALTLTSFLEFIREKFFLSQDCEITLEANPDFSFINLNLLAHLRLSGFNRISFGCQSFNDQLLKKIGRLHNSLDSIKAFLLARQAGFENISLDLIFSLPEQTVKDWEDSLEQTKRLGPEHIAAYNLTLGKGTPFYQKWKKKELNLPGEEEQLKMYELAVSFFPEAGYEHYEISSFSLPGRRCRHNQVYWRNGEYLGLGAGATSYLSGERSSNFKRFEKYAQTIRAGSLPIVCKERLEGKSLWGETLMLGLRMIEGISLRQFKARFQLDLRDVYAQVISGLIAEKLVVIKAGRLRLTPKGIIFSNEVFTRFLT